MEFVLEDFIPYYPPYHAKGFNNPKNVYPDLQGFYDSIPRKSEFDALRLDKENIATSSGLYKHQVFMTRFMSPLTPYNRALVFHGIGTGKCVHPDTLVQIHPASNLPIKMLWDDKLPVIERDDGQWIELKKPIFVSSYNPQTQTIEPRQIVHVFREHIDSYLVKYTLERGQPITCTVNHKFWTNQGWKANLSVDDIIKTKQGLWDKVVEVSNINYKGYVYDLDVDTTHSYIANGYVTHNTCLMVSVAEAAMKIKTDHKKMIILVPTPNLKKNPLKELKPSEDPTRQSCVGDKYKAPEEDPKTKEKLPIEKQRSRTESNIKKVYTIQTFNEFAKAVNKYQTEAELIAAYNNTYIFVDEAHKILSHTAKGQEESDSESESEEKEELVEDADEEKPKARAVSTKNFDAMKRVFHTVPGCKVLLYTATPMIDNPSEIVPLIKLLSSKDKAETIEKASFIKNYYEDNILTDEGKTKLMQEYLYGIVSYVRSETSNVKVIDQGTTFPAQDLNLTKVVTCNMSEFQEQEYIQAYRSDKGIIDDEEEKTEDDEDLEMLMEEKLESKGLWKNSLKASTFVYPNGKFDTATEDQYVKVEKEPFVKQVMIRGKKTDKTYYRTIGLSITDKFDKFLTKNVKPTDNLEQRQEKILAQIERCSTKFATIIRGILEAKRKGEKVYVFSRFVRGGGANLLAALLGVFGYKEIDKKSSDVRELNKAPRFALLTGSNVTATQLDNLVSKTGVLNSKDNMYGDYVQVVIGSDIVTEGLDFKHIRHVYVLVPKWNLASLDQAVGRAIRSDSHNDLPEEQRTINIFKLVAVPTSKIPNIESVDVMVYQRAETKDYLIKQMERVLKEVSFDCVLNKKRNINTLDTPFSRSCDYDDCEYSCFEVDPLYDISTPQNKRIGDTNNLIYATNEVEFIISTVKRLFSLKNKYSFDELLQGTSLTTFNRIVLARALSQMIGDNTPVINKRGFVNYVREENNIYFLVDDPTSSNLFSNAWYAENPIPENVCTFSEMETIYLASQIDSVITLLRNANKDQVKTILFNCPQKVSMQIVEQTFVTIDQTPTKASGLAKTIFDIYSAVIKKRQGLYRHKLSEVPKVLRNGVWELDIEPEDQEEEEEETTVDKRISEGLRVEGLVPFGEGGLFKILLKRVPHFKKDGSIDTRGETGLECNTGKFQGSKFLPFIYTFIKKSIELGIDAPYSLPLKEYSEIEGTLFTTYKKDYETYIKPHVLKMERIKTIIDHFDKNKVQLYNWCEANKKDLPSTKQNWIVKDRFLTTYSNEEIGDILEEYANDSIAKFYSELPTSLQKSEETIIKEELTPEVQIALCRAVINKGTSNCVEIKDWLGRYGLVKTISKK